MEPKDWFTLSVSVLSLCVAGYAVYRTSKHNDQMRAYTAEMRGYASAGPMLTLAGQIAQARKALSDILQKMAEITKGKPEEKLTPTEQRKRLDLEPAYHDASETLLNAFDMACILYRAGGLPPDLFRRQYEVDIRQLVEEGSEYDRKRLNDISSPFRAVRAVYDEWFNREK